MDERWFLAREQDGYLWVVYTTQFIPAAGSRIPEGAGDTVGCGAPSGTLICFVFDEFQSRRLTAFRQFLEAFGDEGTDTFYDLVIGLVDAGVVATGGTVIR